MQPVWSDDSLFDRRQWLKYGALLGSTLGGLVASGQAAPVPSASSSLQRSARQYGMRKSINLWAFPYPAKMTLQECFGLARRAGFDAVEVNYNLEGDLSPAAGEKELAGIRAMADKAGMPLVVFARFSSGPTHSQRTAKVYAPGLWTLLQE